MGCDKGGREFGRERDEMPMMTSPSLCLRLRLCGRVYK
jgi:hypothetical protein